MSQLRNIHWPISGSALVRFALASAILACSTGEGGSPSPDPQRTLGTEDDNTPSPTTGGSGAAAAEDPTATGEAACALGLDPATVEPSPLRLERGFNLGNRLDAPREGAWAAPIRREDLQSISGRGFDHVRMPLRLSAHALAEPPYTVDCAFLQRVDDLLSQALELGLSVVLDIHHYDELTTAPAQHGERFVAFWRQLSARYATLPERVAFELLNEPHGALDAEWNGLAARALEVVREKNPDRLVIIDAQNHSRFQSLLAQAAETTALELPSGDPHLMAAAHVYEPSAFCFQGTAFSGPEFGTTGLVFPGPPSEPVEPVAAARDTEWLAGWFAAYNSEPAETNPGGRAAIDSLLDIAVRFREQTGYDVYVSEVCTAWRADVESRTRYLSALRSGLEQRDLGYAVWDTGGETDLWSPTRNSWLEPITTALFEDP